MKERAAFIVDEDKDTLAFLDKRPLFKGHCLIVPRKHIETIMEMEETMVDTLFRKVRKISQAVQSAMDSQGIYVANNNIISQSVPHFHVHVVPRNKKDGLVGFFWPRKKYKNDEEAQEITRKISTALKELES